MSDRLTPRDRETGPCEERPGGGGGGGARGRGRSPGNTLGQDWTVRTKGQTRWTSSWKYAAQPREKLKARKCAGKENVKKERHPAEPETPQSRRQGSCEPPSVVGGLQTPLREFPS